MRHPLLSCCFAGLLLVQATPSAYGQSEAQLEQAREHFERGVELYQDEEYEEALAEFIRAHDLSRHYALLYNIGLVQAHLARYPEAVSSLELYLSEGGDDIPTNRRAEIGRELRRLRTRIGELRIRLDGPSNATLVIDGTEIATSSLEEPIPVSVGRRTVELRASGYLPYRREVIVAGGVEVAVRASLVEAPTQSGAIIVSLDVPGATISLDGEQVGQTPLEGPLIAAPGRHIIEAERPGYRAAGRTVEVELGEFATVELALLPLEEIPSSIAGQIALDISENDAEVFLDGVPLGEGPVPVGEHVLEVRLGGFHSWWAEIDISQGETTRVDVDLRPTETFLSRYRRRARRWRLIAGITLGLGVAILGANLGLYLWNRQRDEDWRAECDFLVQDALLEDPTIGDETSRSRYDAAAALGHELETWSIVMWVILGVGIAAVGTGVGLFASGPNPRRYDLSFAPIPSGFVVGARTTF